MGHADFAPATQGLGLRSACSAGAIGCGRRRGAQRRAPVGTSRRRPGAMAKRPGWPCPGRGWIRAIPWLPRAAAMPPDHTGGRGAGPLMTRRTDAVWPGQRSAATCPGRGASPASRLPRPCRPRFPNGAREPDLSKAPRTTGWLSFPSAETPVCLRKWTGVSGGPGTPTIRPESRLRIIVSEESRGVAGAKRRVPRSGRRAGSLGLLGAWAGSSARGTPGSGQARPSGDGQASPSPSPTTAPREGAASRSPSSQIHSRHR